MVHFVKCTEYPTLYIPPLQPTFRIYIFIFLNILSLFQYTILTAEKYMSVIYKVQSTEYRVQSSKFKVQSTKYKVQSTKYKVQSTKYKVHIKISKKLQRNLNLYEKGKNT